jgi:predicted ATPase
MELDYITIRGFRSISLLEKLALRPINVVIGANGSGKSNFIGAFSFLHAIKEGRLNEYVRTAGGADELLFFGSKMTGSIQMEVSFNDEVNKYLIELKPTADDSLVPVKETVSFWDKKKGYPRPYEDTLAARESGREAGISSPRLKGTADWVRIRLSRWRLYHVHDTSMSSPLRRTAKLDDNAFLRPDGANLASFLYLLKEKFEGSYSLIRGVVQRVAPYFDDFVLEPDRRNEDTIKLAWKHKQSDKYFGASSLSDGTLRFMLLATLFLQDQKFIPSVVLVDEPELGLHPYAITVLAAMVKRAAKKTQVILSTQSPLLLDHFDPEDVLVANQIDGGTSLTRLRAEPLEKWLEDYSLGQLWEKNEFGGRPGSAAE